jgi:hypothetical protein
MKTIGYRHTCNPAMQRQRGVAVRRADGDES